MTLTGGVIEVGDGVDGACLGRRRRSRLDRAPLQGKPEDETREGWWETEDLWNGHLCEGKRKRVEDGVLVLRMSE